MDLKLLCYDYFLVVFLLTCYHGHGLFEDDYDDAPPSFGRCPWIRNKLKNGRVKLRSRGRIAKFLCDPGYELAGKRFATCVRGQWNNPIPVCVARGCSRKPAIRNGRITEMYRGAMLVYDCNPGYSLDGSISIHCDGRRWSSDPPACVITTSDPETMCDFEDPDLCGWSHDPTHDFDWKRNQFSTPSGHVGTGPSYDHTFGVGKGGFYLYLEASSPRKVNDVSRLFSPVYPSDLSGGCFIFWYHMYGATTGGLRVYLKPESHVFGELSPTWEKFGDQGNQWLRGHIPIPSLHESFQLVIEGIRGASYVGDSAIDDVQLTKSDCESMENATDTVADTVAESCRGRCREPDEESSCGCNENCMANDACCNDYATICTSGNDTSAENPDETLPVEELGKTSSLVTMTITKSTVAENTEINITTSKKMIITKTVEETTEAATTTISSSTSSTVSSSTLPSTSTAAITTLSTTEELIYNITVPPESISTTKSSTTEIKSPTTKESPPADITNSPEKPASEKNTTVMTPSATEVLSTQSPDLTTVVLTTATATSTSSTLLSTTLVLETTSAEHNSSEIEVPMAISTSGGTIEDIGSSTYNASSSTSIPSSSTSIPSSSTSSASTTSMPSTRKTYNLRPRTQKTTPITQEYSSSVSSTTIPDTTTSSTIEQTVVSSSVTPQPVTETLTSISSSNAADTTTLPSVSLRPFTTITSTSSTVPSSTSTKEATTTTTLRTSTTLSKLATKMRYWIPTTNLVTVRIPRSTESVYQILTTPSSVSSHASKSASTKSNSGSQPTITIVSISVVAILCIAGGLAYYMKKHKSKRQSKLSEDSEMRFLQENEFMESSDASAADILGKW